MGFKGAIIGCFIGSLRGPLSSLFCSIVGSMIEDQLKSKRHQRTRRAAPFTAPRRDALSEAYRALGVEPTASFERIKKAYHEMAKKYHPDTLRAQGLSDELIGKATERMKRINAAWTLIKEHRQ